MKKSSTILTSTSGAGDSPARGKSNRTDVMITAPKNKKMTENLAAPEALDSSTHSSSTDTHSRAKMNTPAPTPSTVPAIPPGGSGGPPPCAPHDQVSSVLQRRLPGNRSQDSKFSVYCRVLIQEDENSQSWIPLSTQEVLTPQIPAGSSPPGSSLLRANHKWAFIQVI